MKLNKKKESYPKLIIVGAGIAGLCAGVYGRQCGFDVEIIEMSDSTGGLATSWRREDYVFENCLHWLLGSNPKSSWHSLWKEVFDIDSLNFINHKEFIRLESEGVDSVSIPLDPEKMRMELMKISPEDHVAIDRFVAGVKRLKNFDFVPEVFEWKSILSLIKATALYPEILFWSHQTTKEFAHRFKHPMLQRFFKGNLEDMSALGLVMSLAWMVGKNAGYPIGGSRAVIDSIEKKFRDLGGRIRLNSKVDRIIVKDNKAVGVHIADSTEIYSNWVISAADGHSTLLNWIPSGYLDEVALLPYKTLSTFPSYIQVSLGIKRDLKDEPVFFSRKLNEPITIDPQTRIDEISFRVFSFDPTFATKGKTAVTCFIPTCNYQYWTSISRNSPGSYAKEKERITKAVIDVLERRNPGISNDIEVTDISTPASVIRYTGNWKGSMEGFIMTPQTGFGALRMNLPKLKNFKMIGQWVMPGGGLPSGLVTSRRAIKSICHDEHIGFLEKKSISKFTYRPQESASV